MDDFTDDQKRYLEGFVSGQAAARAAKGLAPFFPVASGGDAMPAGPEAIHFRAQSRFVAAGKKLVAEEEAKRQKNPLDMWDELVANARDARFPKGTDVFLLQVPGLFYVAPAQDSFMCRLRIPGGILDSHQLRGVADLAERYGGGYADVTTRANLQIREIRPENTVARAHGACRPPGIVHRGAGADNIRNITGSPTAGIDPQELIDTRPLGRATAPLHPEPPRAVRPAAQVQHRLRRRRPRRARSRTRTTSASPPSGPRAAFRRRLLPAASRRHHRAQGLRARHAACCSCRTSACRSRPRSIRVFIEHGDRTDRRRRG